MKKIVILLIAISTWSTMGWAQQNVNQLPITTQIADLLALMPAKDSAQMEAYMNRIGEMGEKGLVEMAAMLSAPGQGDNSSMEYAIGGFSFYTIQNGKEDWRKMSVSAYCQALDRVTHEENKAFIIRQLQIVGKDDAVACLQAYLNDERLCDPAARALIKVNSPAANQALLQALGNAQGSCRLSLVEALGDSRYREAAPVIAPLAASEDKSLSKVALYALAHIADPASEKVLAQAAERTNFTYDSTNATAAYLTYIQGLAETGEQRKADKLARRLLKKSNKASQVHTRTAALKLLADMRGEKSVPLLVSAAGDEQPEYRAAALKFALDYTNPSTTSRWVKKLKRSDADVQAEILTMLGRAQAEAALPDVLNALKSENSQTRLAAIAAAGKIGQEAALSELLNMMKTGGQEEIAAVKNALLLMKGNSVVPTVTAALPAMPAAAQAASLAFLGSRGAHESVSAVFTLANSENADVRMAALSALAQMVRKENLPQLFTLLSQTSQSGEVRAVQDAIVAAAGDIGEQSQQADLVLQQMSQVAADKKPLYFNVLAGIGGEKALETVAQAFRNGDTPTKESALAALAAWSDMSAANELLRISRETSNSQYLDQALTGYIRSVSMAKAPAAQKILMLREAMEVAQTDTQKQTILKEVAKNRTFPALLFAGKYLDDPALQQEAATAVMNIALSNQAYSGDIVRELLSKTMQVIQGPDSEYQKESMRKFLAEMPEGEGFVSIFNGKDLTGWKGLVGDPLKRAKMSAKTLAREQQKADEIMRKGWQVKDGELIFTGQGDNISTVKKYGDFEMFVDWKITKDGDAGIYLRGTPQVQIWDPALVEVGAQVGSGGLYNNEKNESKPLKRADNPVGEWNTFRILMKGDRATVHLNGELVVDNVILENYWDRSQPIFPEEFLELQAHGTHVAYRDIYIREIPRPKPFTLSPEEKKEGFKVLFDGTNMHHWMGNTQDYIIEDGDIVIYPERGGKGNLFTKEEYSDFAFRFEFQLTPGANNGLGIRAPLEGDAAYVGMELQILDNDAEIYKNLKPYQYHGSVYGVMTAERGHLKPVGEWNYQEVIVKGPQVKVILNGNVILDGDIAEASKNGTLDGLDHPGLKRDTGHIGFLGHGSVVRFRNIRVKDLSKASAGSGSARR